MNRTGCGLFKFAEQENWERFKISWRKK